MSITIPFLFIFQASRIPDALHPLFFLPSQFIVSNDSYYLFDAN